MQEFKKQLYTVIVFTKIGTRRFFRDRLAIFFGILFPLIFLFVFGTIANGNKHVSFKVAIINDSNSSFSKPSFQAVLVHRAHAWLGIQILAP